MFSTSATGRWLLVGFEEVVHALLYLCHLFLAPSLALKGVDFGSNADFSGQHSSDFSSNPSRGPADPRVHENMTVLGRGCTRFEVMEERLLRPEDLYRP